jgi:predicted GH43/DUF377 family glycosyl hydrolase
MRCSGRKSGSLRAGVRIGCLLAAIEVGAGLPSSGIAFADHAVAGTVPAHPVSAAQAIRAADPTLGADTTFAAGAADTTIIVAPDSLPRPAFVPGSDPIAAAWSQALSIPPKKPSPEDRVVTGVVRPWRRPNTRPSRTLFEKFPANPVVGLGSKGSLDSGHAEYPSVVQVGGLLWMFYSAFGAHHRWEIAAAVSPDGIRWTKLGVVLSPDTTTAAWDSTTIAFPSVIYSEEAPPAERFRMWYAGKHGSRYEGIGLATSTDGRRWRREGRVLSLGQPGEWDGVEIADPSVLAVSGGYRMYYCGTPDSGRVYRVGVAFSADGRTWTKAPDNPVYALETGMYTVDVIPYNSDLPHGDEKHGFVLFASSPNPSREYEVHAVHSDDGLRFDTSTRRLVLAPARDDTWDHAVVYGMDVVPYGGQLYMWFNGIYTYVMTPRGGEVGLARAPYSKLGQLLDHP